jgi:hypothetical protein
VTARRRMPSASSVLRLVRDQEAGGSGRLAFLWCVLVYSGDMGVTLVGADSIRRSISLPTEMAEKLDSIAGLGT